LNDASLGVLPESSAIRFGFRCGFLGMLHMELSRRLEREFNMTVITTFLTFRTFTKGSNYCFDLNNPSDLPEPSRLDHVKSLLSKATIITKADYVGNVMSLCIENVADYQQTI
jgi:GTP-binding protein LepA